MTEVTRTFSICHFDRREEFNDFNYSSHLDSSLHSALLSSCRMTRCETSVN